MGVAALPGESDLVARAETLRSRYLAAPKGRLLLAEAEARTPRLSYHAQVDHVCLATANAHIV